MPDTCETCRHWNGRPDPPILHHRTIEGYAACELARYGEGMMAAHLITGDGPATVYTQGYFGCLRHAPVPQSSEDRPHG